jgi:hypothetical protein
VQERKQLTQGNQSQTTIMHSDENRIADSVSQNNKIDSAVDQVSMMVEQGTSVLYNTASDSFAVGGETNEFFLAEGHDIGEVIDEAVVEGSLSDLTENMRNETISNIAKALDKGRKHVWELAARRVSALLSCDALCTTSPHHFLQSLDWVNKFVLAGEAFSGSKAISLRAKLVKLCEKYFSSFHRQNLEVELQVLFHSSNYKMLRIRSTFHA